MDDIIYKIAVNAIPLLLAITLHEAAHGYAARVFGDRTAEMLGRIPKRDRVAVSGHVAPPD